MDEQAHYNSVLSLYITYPEFYEEVKKMKLSKKYKDSVNNRDRINIV